MNELIDLIYNSKCEKCQFLPLCDNLVNEGNKNGCGILLSYAKEKKKKKPYTLRELGFGEDDTPAKYVKVGNTKGYLGAILGIEGYWSVIICNKYGKAIKYKAISVKNLNEIKEINIYE